MCVKLLYWFYTWHQIDGYTYRAWEEDAILEMTEEVGNEEAAQHQAHRQQGSVEAWSQGLAGFCAVDSFILVICVVAVSCIFIVPNQRVSLENLYRGIG